MKKEFVLDIGIRAGGSYINTHTAQSEKRIGVDLDYYKLHHNVQAYPDVSLSVADAQHLPFRDNTFCRIEFVMPFDTLCIPGLQNHHFGYTPISNMKQQKEFPHGWYPEFQRVLKPKGTIVV